MEIFDTGDISDGLIFMFLAIMASFAFKLLACPMQKILSGNITIPHKRMFERNFVLFPMYELDKNWIHPKKNISIRKLIFSFIPSSKSS